MGASLVSIIINNLPVSISVFVAVLALGIYLAFKLGGHLTQFKGHGDAITKMAETLPNMLVEVGKITTKVDMIYGFVNPHRPVATMSPISLTPSGKEIVENIKADTLLKKCLPQLTKEVEVENPGNAYDIQMVAMKVAKEKMLPCLNNEEQATVKQEAYNRGLIVEDIMSVFGVLLRDHILSQKGLPIAEVDKYTPGEENKKAAGA